VSWLEGKMIDMCFVFNLSSIMFFLYFIFNFGVLILLLARNKLKN